MQTVNPKTKDHEDSDNLGAVRTSENSTSSQLRRKTGNHSTADDGISQAPKRQRVSQACEQCRAKKYKCDAIHPRCSACASSNEPCSYRTSIKKRGLPTGYVRVLEMLWGAVFLEHSGSEVAVEALVTGEKGIFARIEKDGVYAELLLKTWRQSTILKAVDRYLGNEETPNNGKAGEQKYKDQDTRLGEGESACATNTMRHEALIPHEWTRNNNAEIPYTRLASNGRESTAQDIAVFDSVWTGSNTLAVNHGGSAGVNGAATHSDLRERPYPVLSLALPTNAMQLINIYISYTHCWFPVIERDIFWKVSFEYSGRTLKMSGTSPGSGKHAALWAILAYASIQDVARGQSSDATGLEGVHLSTEQIYSNARGLIPSEDANFEQGHVQALLLLVLVNLGLGNVTAAWLLIGQAARRALDMGLDMSPVNASEYPDQETSSGSHKHIFSGCFALDTLVAARLGRRPHLRRADITEVGQFRTDGQEEYEPWRDCFDLDPGRGGVSTGAPHRLHIFSIFLQFTKLAGILNDLLCDVPDGHNSEHYYQEMSTKLDRWVAELPPHGRLAMLNTSYFQQSTSAVPQLLNLHLMYQSTIALLQLQSDQGFEGTSGIYDHIREVYLNAASQALELLQHFSKTFGIFVMPSTFRYFTSVVSQGLSLSANQSNGEMNSTTILRRDLRQTLSGLERVWVSRKATPIIAPIQPCNDGSRLKGVQATSNFVTKYGTMNTPRVTDAGASLCSEKSKQPTINQSAQPGYHTQVSGVGSNSLFKNVTPAENQGFLQSRQATTESFPIWAQDQPPIETYSKTHPSTSPAHLVEIAMTGYQTGSDMDITQGLSPSEWRNPSQHSPLPYTIRTALVHPSSPYAKPGTLPPDLQTTEAIFGSPFALSHSAGDFGVAGNSEAVWDELACLDDGERCALPLFFILI